MYGWVWVCVGGWMWVGKSGTYGLTHAKQALHDWVTPPNPGCVLLLLEYEFYYLLQI
jgi:hypothetical protein